MVMAFGACTAPKPTPNNRLEITPTKVYFTDKDGTLLDSIYIGHTNIDIIDSLETQKDIIELQGVIDDNFDGEVMEYRLLVPTIIEKIKQYESYKR